MIWELYIYYRVLQSIDKIIGKLLRSYVTKLLSLLFLDRDTCMPEMSYCITLSPAYNVDAPFQICSEILH
jgi:hypothetical protein